MRLTYCANGVAGHIDLPIACIEVMTAESLAELAASCHWRDHHPAALPGELTRVHLQDLDGKELGMFEVRREMRPVFTASALPGRG